LRDSRVLLQNLSVRLGGSESCYEISFRETRKKRFSLRNFVARLLFAVLATKFMGETHEKRVSLLIFDSRVLRKSHENFGPKKRDSLLARFSKSDSRVNPNCDPCSSHMRRFHKHLLNTYLTLKTIFCLSFYCIIS
jgi:hypothetical protein